MDKQQKKKEVWKKIKPGEKVLSLWLLGNKKSAGKLLK